MKRKGKCFLVSFSDDTAIKVHAKTKAEVRHIIDRPSTITQIRVLGLPGSSKKVEQANGSHAIRGQVVDSRPGAGSRMRTLRHKGRSRK